ncbi:MAG: TRAP transporter substrate-binding protein [Pseudomonadota bacterium]
MKRRTIFGVATAALALSSAAGWSAPAAAEENFSLAYFMGPGHPMNGAVFQPFADRLAEVSDGQLTVEMFPGGALNSAPPRQYATVVEGVADIVFALPGYTAQLFPVTNVITVPNVAADAVDGTEALWRARDLIEQEYDAQILAMWTNAAPVLITRDTPIRSLDDLDGMVVRVTSAQDVPFVEALGASAVSQPVSVINQNLTNGTIDAIAIDPSAIGSFNLWEPANYVTIGLPGSGSAFVLLMNQEVYDGLTEQEQAWVDEASGEWLSLNGGQVYLEDALRGIEVARDNGVEIIELSDDEVARFNEAMQPAMDAFLASTISGDLTGADVVDIMQGNN